MRFLSSLRWLLAAALIVAGLASAQTYPDKTKPIRVIVPSGVGTSIDLLALPCTHNSDQTSYSS